MRLPKTFFAQGAMAGCIFYLMALLTLFPGPNVAVPAAPRDVALVACSFGILSTLAWSAYISRTAATTVRTYISRMGIAIAIVTMSLLAWYIDAIVIRPVYAGPPETAWLITINSILATIVTHQFVRGYLTMRSRWKTSNDIFDSLRAARLVTVQAAGRYDYAFYVSVTIAIGIVARSFKAQSLVFYIGGATLALVVPHICGAQLSRHLTVRRLLPNDAQLPPELQM